MMVRCKFGPGDRADIWVDNQHLSRLREQELREIIIQLLVFGGSKLRSDITGWLSGGKLNELGELLAPEEQQSGGALAEARSPKEK